LVVFRPGINVLYDIQSFYHFPECRISLTIGVVVPAVIKSWLVAYTNEEFAGSCSRGRSCQGDHPILMEDMGLLGSLMGNAGERNGFPVMSSPEASLYQLRLRGIGGLIVIVEYPVETAVLVKPGIYIG